MRDTITEFMWGFQGHFRNSVQHEIGEALQLIGLDADPLVLLVGDSDAEDAVHPICVEPETGRFTSHDLSGIGPQAELLYENDPDLLERHQHELFQHATGRAIAQAIEQSRTHQGRTIIVGPPGRHGEYDVYTVVLLDEATFEQPSAFETETVDRVYLGRSLQHEVVSECLRRSAEAVQVADAGGGLSVLGSSRSDLVRVARRRFLDGLTIRAAGAPTDLFENICRITELLYERSAARGRVMVTRQGAAKVDIELVNPVRMTNARSVRKLLETCVSSSNLISDGRSLFGLSRNLLDVGPDDVGLLNIVVSGTAEWEVHWGRSGTCMFRSEVRSSRRVRSRRRRSQTRLNVRYRAAMSTHFGCS